MTLEEKIAGAAEIIVTELARRGSHVPLSEAVQIAKTLYAFWHDRVQADIKPGEIARRFRTRYERQVS